MNSFSKYMDQVKADRELKARTETYVISEINKRKAETEFRNKRRSVKRLTAAAMSLAACFILALGGYAFYNTPINYICIDINPSIELGINAFGRIVDTEAYNNDGSLLLSGSGGALRNMKADEAVTALITEAAERGYISEDGSTVIALTAESNSSEATAKLSQRSEEGAAAALKNGGLSAVIYTDCGDTSLRQEAKEAGVSPGKLKLINVLKSLKPEASVDDYKDAKIKEIIIQIDELMSEQAGGSLNTDLQDAAAINKEIREAALKLKNNNPSSEADSPAAGKESNSKDKPGNQDKNQNNSAEGTNNSGQRRNDSEEKNAAEKKNGKEEKEKVKNGSADTDKQKGKNKNSSSGKKSK
jgi:hypothetical protein